MLHNRLQSILHSMMKVGGIVSEKEEEAVNILANKVGKPYHRYIHHVAPYPNARRAPFGVFLGRGDL